VAVTREEVVHVARLARLALGEDETRRLQDDLTHILDAFETLQRLGAADDEPFAPLDDRLGGLRADVVDNPAGDDALLDGAPDRHGRLFHVPKIIE
jgi:aspartyl-tRNA(Asn)/glutamyl-tRNA(Gln) amidotransferase subunit C